MKIGFVTASVSRKAGGLSPIVLELSRSLVAAGVETEIFSGKDAFTNQDLSSWGGIPVHLSEVIGPRAFGYTPKLANYLNNRNPDVLHTHGIWMYPSALTKDWSRGREKPWIVSPHGMLDQWALKNSGWKKIIARLVYEDSHLKGSACLHALSHAEADAFRQFGLKNPIAVIPNGVAIPALTELVEGPAWLDMEPKRNKILLFLGRIHPKKGLINLIKAWSGVASRERKEWSLVIAGWAQNNHEAELKKLVSELGLDDFVSLIGPRFGEDKSQILAHADAFVLPSFSEGLPVAVLEAWSYELPVLMTPQCNIPEGFVAGAAISIDPSEVSIASGLRELFALKESDLSQMGVLGRALIEARFSWPKIANQMADVYRWVLKQGPMPECVRLD